MTDLEEQRAALQRSARDRLQAMLGAEGAPSARAVFPLAIQRADKELCPEEYAADLHAFKLLFGGGVRMRYALWNMLTEVYSEETEICAEDFSAEERAFLAEAFRAAGTPVEMANVNRTVKTRRLLLRPVEKGDRGEFTRRFLADGDFLSFTGMEPTPFNAGKFAVGLRRCAHFAVVRRSDGALLGFIGLDLRARAATAMLQCYIFREERRKGYCTEGLLGLLARVRERGIYAPAETLRNGIYKRKRVPLNAVRALIPSANEAARRTAEKSGFAREAVLRQTVRGADGAWSDEEIYCYPLLP